VVVDNKASTVFVFIATSGKLVNKYNCDLGHDCMLNRVAFLRFGTRGSERHQLAGPHFAAVNSRGEIVVSDFHNHAIKVSKHESMQQIVICFWKGLSD